VIVAKRACALLPEARAEWQPLAVDAELCNGCGRCFRVGCPAIVRSDEIDDRTKRAKARIDVLLCTGCEICAQVCPQKAIAGRAGSAGQESETE
jgi:indolepyruvate ferredoxin oxidoreductase alpha subunit